MDKIKEERRAVDDEKLLRSFFSEARQPIADNGFTERVMSALPERAAALGLSDTLRLHRWSLWLNIMTVVGVVGLLIYLGFFTRSWIFMQGLVARIVMGVLSYDYDGLLVHAMLFLHRLPEMMPTATQLVALFLTALILMPLIVQRLVKQW